MNKRDMQQLKASIARDLVQGQGENSATRDLLKQYVPLNGIVSKPEQDIPPQMPVENCLAPRATLAPHATQARYARVKGELRVPNTINFSLFPTLDPFAKAIYYQLFLLSHGFHSDTCLINLPALAKLVLMSQRKVQNTISYLESRGFVKRIGFELGGESRGNYYQVLISEIVPTSNPNIPPEKYDKIETGCMAPYATLARGATIKNDDDDIKTKNKSSSKGEEDDIFRDPVENHTSAAAPREKETAEQNFLLVREAHEKTTGNCWNQSDSETYQQNKIGNVPAAKIVSILEAVVRRTPTKINSFKYFVKEITAQPDPHTRAWQKKRLEKIMHKIRDISVGRSNYSMADFVEDVKCSCAREGIVFENDLFNELVS